MIKKEVELVDELIDDINKEIIVCRVKIREFESEIAKPRYMGKNDALESLSIYKKRMKTLERNLTNYKNYDIC